MAGVLLSGMRVLRGWDFVLRGGIYVLRGGIAFSEVGSTTFSGGITSEVGSVRWDRSEVGSFYVGSTFRGGIYVLRGGICVLRGGICVLRVGDLAWAESGSSLLTKT